MLLVGLSDKVNHSITWSEIASQKCHTKCHKLVPVFGSKIEHKAYVSYKNQGNH